MWVGWIRIVSEIVSGGADGVVRLGRPMSVRLPFARHSCMLSCMLAYVLRSFSLINDLISAYAKFTMAWFVAVLCLTVP